MILVKISGIVIICLFSVVLLRNMKFENAFLPVIAALIAVGAMLIESDILSTFTSLKELSYDNGINKYLTVLIKALGISYLSVVTSDICKTVGEETLAAISLTAGKFEIIALSLPLITELLEAAKGML